LNKPYWEILPLKEFIKAMVSHGKTNVLISILGNLNYTGSLYDSGYDHTNTRQLMEMGYDERLELPLIENIFLILLTQTEEELENLKGAEELFSWWKDRLNSSHLTTIVPEVKNAIDDADVFEGMSDKEKYAVIEKDVDALNLG